MAIFSKKKNENQIVEDINVKFNTMYNILKSINEANISKKLPSAIKLKSGNESDLYFNIRELTYYPSVFESCISFLSEKIVKLSSMENLYLCGCGGFGNAIAANLSIKCNIPLIILREKVKDHGEDREIIGLKNMENPICILIDDVFTTGTTIKEVSDKLKKYQVKIREIIVILNRSFPYISNIKLNLEDIPINCLFNLYHFGNLLGYPLWIEYCQKLKNSKLCISYDKDVNVEDICKFIVDNHKNICAIKLHPEFISDIRENYILLRETSLKYCIILIADMKYGDIGYIVKKQYSAEVFAINKWANLITIHAMNGIVHALETAYREVHYFGILIVANMSNGYDFTNSAIEIVNNSTSDLICGFITQKFIIDGYINFTPGIKLDNTKDNYDQNYSHPHNLPFTHIFIVGRGINDQNDIAKYNNEINAKL